MELGGRVIKKFADGEVYVQIQESIRGCDDQRARIRNKG